MSDKTPQGIPVPKSINFQGGSYTPKNKLSQEEQAAGEKGFLRIGGVLDFGVVEVETFVRYRTDNKLLGEGAASLAEGLEKEMEDGFLNRETVSANLFQAGLSFALKSAAGN